MKIMAKLVNILLVLPLANAYFLCRMGMQAGWCVLWAALALAVLIRPFYGIPGLRTRRLRQCEAGVELLWAFLGSVVLTAVLQLAVLLGMKRITFGVWDWILDILLIVVIESMVFWDGIIRVYVTSVQLGIKWRVIGILCGWIPVAHLFALGKIISIVSAEVRFEQQKLLLDEQRAPQRVCATRYPVLLLHGVFFRDFRYINYWGRIPEELQKNGAVIFYGNHQSAASVADSGREIAERIRQIMAETGCGKVNIIAHSKGGLDARYAISCLGMAPYVASLTTINTPHRGCEFADYLLEKIPAGQQQAIARTYNAALRKLGDFAPDFLAAVRDLTSENCAALNAEMKTPEGVYIQSVGSSLRKPSGGRFPLNLTTRFVHRFDGENDGLVGKDSFSYGQRFIWLSVPGNRGISHGDMIDLNRENLPEFDVREFYVKLLEELKSMGM